MSDYIYMLESHLSPDQNRAVEETQAAAALANVNVFLTGGAMRDMLGGFRIRDLDFVVEGNALTLVSQGATSRGTFQLDSVPTPRTLDVTFTEGPEKGNRYLGIYELQEDTWRFCRTPAGKGRPTAFAGKAGSGHLLETLHRADERDHGPRK